MRLTKILTRQIERHGKLVAHQPQGSLRQANIDLGSKAAIDYFLKGLKGEKSVSRDKMREELVSAFLGVEYLDTCMVEKSWSRFWFPMLAMGFFKVVSDNYSIIEWPKQHKWGRELADVFTPTYEDVEVGLGKSINLPISGNYFIKRADVPVYCQFVFNSPYNDPFVTVRCSKEHKAEAEDLLFAVDTWMKTHNIYKNQLLAFENGRLNFMAVPPCSWKDVVLPPDIIKQVRRSTVDMLKRRGTFYDVGLGVRRSILLDGPPGVGKTQVGRALSNELYSTPETFATTLWVSTRSIDRSQEIRSLYSAARALAPTVLILEDVDLIGRARNTDGPSYLLGELLTQMDGAEDNRGLITVATTNDLASIDYALTKRPGRFDRLLSVPLPNREARDVMLRRFVKARKGMVEKGIMVKGSTWDKILDDTDGMTGAYLQEVVNTAVIEAINSDSVRENRPVLSAAHLTEALTLIKDTFGRSPRDYDGQEKLRKKFVQTASVEKYEGENPRPCEPPVEKEEETGLVDELFA